MPRMSQPEDGRRLAGLIERNRTSAYALAKAAGMPSQRLYDLVHGRRTITYETAKRLAPLLGVTPQLLLGEAPGADIADRPAFNEEESEQYLAWVGLYELLRRRSRKALVCLTEMAQLCIAEDEWRSLVHGFAPMVHRAFSTGDASLEKARFDEPEETPSARRTRKQGKG